MSNTAVVIAITILAGFALAAGAVLRSNGVDASDLITLGGAGLGALAGFLTSNGKAQAPAAAPAPVQPLQQPFAE